MAAPAVRAEVALALALAALFGVVIGTALGYPRDARLFPIIIGTGGLVLSLALALAVMIRGGAPLADTAAKPDEARDAHGSGRIVLAVLASPVFGLLLWLVGFWIATAIAVFAVPWMMGYRNKAMLALLALGTIAVLALTFPYLLKVGLPIGVFGEWFLATFVHAR